MEITFIIPGKPYAKKRAKATAFAGRARMYDPKENGSFEETVKAIAAKHFAEPITGPIGVDIVATFVPAASWSKKKRAAAIGGYHTQKPDRDNVEKAVLDSLNRIAWGDDAQVADGRTVKVWGDVAQTKVTVRALGQTVITLAE